jgi:hypothetical protein
MKYNIYTSLTLALASALAYEAVHGIPASYLNAHIEAPETINAPAFNYGPIMHTGAYSSPATGSPYPSWPMPPSGLALM